VAAAYATAIYTWSPDESVIQWLASFSSLVTPKWWRTFSSADPVPPPRATTALVQRVLAAHAPQDELPLRCSLPFTPAGGALSWSTS
jgi:hypothetical protein